MTTHSHFHVGLTPSAYRHYNLTSSSPLRTNMAREILLVRHCNQIGFVPVHFLLRRLLGGRGRAKCRLRIVGRMS